MRETEANSRCDSCYAKTVLLDNSLLTGLGQVAENNWELTSFGTINNYSAILSQFQLPRPMFLKLSLLPEDPTEIPVVN